MLSIKRECKAPTVMKHGLNYEKKFHLGPAHGQIKCFNLVLTWTWSGQMSDICFKRTDDSIEEIKDFKKIQVNLKRNCEYITINNIVNNGVLCYDESQMLVAQIAFS